MLNKERFMQDIKDHQMEITYDDGVNRNLVFNKNGSSCYKFTIVTWAGHLCITGDCGTYVFSRIDDMFKFFRGEGINSSYWAEKCLSGDVMCGIKRFSFDEFTKNVTEYFNDNSEDMSDEDKESLWQDIEAEVLSADSNPVRAFDAANDYRNEEFDFEFIDFWEYSHEEFTHQFIWNLYAIVHGISEYDKLNDGENNVSQ